MASKYLNLFQTRQLWHKFKVLWQKSNTFDATQVIRLQLTQEELLLPGVGEAKDENIALEVEVNTIQGPLRIKRSVVDLESFMT